MAIALDNLAFGADDVGGEHAGAVQIQPRIEHIFVERIDPKNGSTPLRIPEKASVDKVNC
jgi:hypothetical protein